MRKIIAILCILYFAGGIVFPGNRKLHFNHISVEQGLSQSTVLSIYQDRSGFMWFGTLDGLNRYDGNNIRIYQANPNDPYSLSNNLIWAIDGDDSGFLWIATENGLNKLDPRSEKFYSYKMPINESNGASNNIIRNLYVDKSGVPWLGTLDNGLTRFDPKTETFTRFSGPPETPLQMVFAICGDKSGNIWIGSNGLFKFTPENGEFIHSSGLSFNAVQTLFYDDKTGILWIGLFNGSLDKFDPQQERLTHYDLEHQNRSNPESNNIRVLWKDQSNALWLGTRTGLARFDIQPEEFFSYKHDPDDPHSLSNNFITSIFEDRSGAVWFGVKGGGLNIYDRKLHKFLCYQHDPNNPKSLSDGNVWGFAEDESGTIWVATEEDGLNKFDPETETFTKYRHDPNDPESISGNKIFSICGSRSGKFWLGTTQGLSEFDPKTGKSIRYSGETDFPLDYTANKLLFDFILTVYEDRSGILWIGTQFGFDRYDPVKKQFSHFLPDPNSLYASTNEIKVIYEDSAGTLWVGTRGGGLYQFDRKTEKFSTFPGKEYKTKGLNYLISSITEDRSGILWVGTKGGGLHKIDREKSKITVYSMNDGLPNNIINGILEDNQGNLWISTTKGLSRYTPTTNTFRNYSQKSGLQSYEFNAGSYYKSKSGEMYFGGTKGFNGFFPGKVIDNMHIPSMVITSFKITDKALGINGDLPLQKEIPLDDQITLSYQDNIFSIEFAALDYTAPEKNQYKCMLEGFNEDWINLGYKNDITFTNLDPGTYTFKVKGSNNDGYWNALGASLKIIITPPFTQTWYFRALMVLLFFGFLFALHKLRTTRIKQDLEKRRLEKELRLKADFTAMLVHDLRSPLTAIIGYSDMLNEMPEQMDVKKTGRVIHRSSEKMLSLINDMLELSKFEAGKMSLERKKCTIVGTVMEIVEIITPLFKKKHIDLVCRFEASAKENKLNIDVEKIGQVITNFLSNAAKFTPRTGKVVIKAFKTGDNFVEITITDNGAGVPLDRREYLFEKYVQFSKGIKAKGTGLGLAVSKMIIEAHGGEIGYRPVVSGKGSMFYFKLPIDSKAKKEKE
ncbi:MAG: hypothetical protein KAT34_02600 [Candidatus Aminicenantes bacterium]|nr:hypothetical protein [Candidatus Aminicenantes bacterium]